MIESELEKKRIVFRESIRRQQIQSYQRKIRNQHQQKLSLPSTNISSFPQNLHDRKLCLSSILALEANQICSVENFYFLVECFEATIKEEPTLEKIIEQFEQKEEIVELIYRIIDQVLEEKCEKISLGIEQILYIAQYPSMMNLWVKISLTADDTVKQCSIKRLIDMFKMDIGLFDSEFVLEMSSNFLIHQPKPPLQYTLSFLPFLASFQQDFMKSLPQINKLTFIFRTILKGNQGTIVLEKIVEEGYQNIIFGIFSVLQVKIQESCSGKKPPLEIMTKLNILKLIYEIYSQNSRVSSFLYGCCANNLIKILVQPLSIANCSLNQKIMCSDHELFLKHLLRVLSMLLKTRENQDSVCHFLQNKGLDFLHIAIQLFEFGKGKGQLQSDWKREIVSILHSIQDLNLSMSFNENMKYLQILQQLLQNFSFTHDRQAGIKVLKLMKNYLINAYTVQPEIFEELSSQVLYTVGTREKLEWLQKVNISPVLSRQILLICQDIDGCGQLQPSF